MVISILYLPKDLFASRFIPTFRAIIFLPLLSMFFFFSCFTYIASPFWPLSSSSSLFLICSLCRDPSLSRWLFSLPSSFPLSSLRPPTSPLYRRVVINFAISSFSKRGCRSPSYFWFVIYMDPPTSHFSFCSSIFILFLSDISPLDVLYLL